MIAIGAIVDFALTRGGDDTAAAPAAAVTQASTTGTTSPITSRADTADEGTAAPVRLTKSLTAAFVGDDPSDPSNVCFGPGRRPDGVAYMIIGGVRYERDIVQCGSKNGPGDANGQLAFDLDAAGVVPGDRIVGFQGDFTLDESATSQSRARIQWTATYEGRGLCRVAVDFGQHGRCRFNTGGVPVRSAGTQLVVRQRVLRSGPRALWAGVHHPVLVIERQADAVGADGTATPAADGDVRDPAGGGVVADPEAESDRIFLDIKAGDFSDGPAAHRLVDQLRGTSDPYLGNAAFNAGVIHYFNGECDLALENFSLAASVRGTQRQNEIRATALTAAREGCQTPLSSILDA